MYFCLYECVKKSLILKILHKSQLESKAGGGHSAKSFYIVILYRTPGSSIPLSLDEFMRLVTYLSTLKSDFVMISDFNI